ERGGVGLGEDEGGVDGGGGGVGSAFAAEQDGVGEQGELPVPAHPSGGGVGGEGVPGAVRLAGEDVEEQPQSVGAGQVVGGGVVAFEVGEDAQFAVGEGA